MFYDYCAKVVKNPIRQFAKALNLYNAGEFVQM